MNVSALSLSYVVESWSLISRHASSLCSSMALYSSSEMLKWRTCEGASSFDRVFFRTPLGGSLLVVTYDHRRCWSVCV